MSKIIKSFLITAIVILLIYLIFVLKIFSGNDGFDSTITDAKLEKAINISNLSTAEFVYNGISEKKSDLHPEKVECYISYNANVKVGISMEDVKFKIDKDKKIVTPILPEISINIATLDEKSISYIPSNPNISLKDVIAICKLDAINEANKSEKLYQTAKENLQSVIEALLFPALDGSGYTITWQD